MPVDLTHPDPIDLADPRFQPLLEKLQGNILKSHGRDYAMHSFFRFRGDPAAARRLVAELTRRYVTSAAEQEQQIARFKAGHEQELFGALMLSAKGMKLLGLTLPAGFGEATLQPATSAPVSFANPMKDAAAVFADQPDQWDAGYRGGDIDGMLLLAMGHAEEPYDADAIPTALLDAAKDANALIDGAAEVVAFEIGQQQRRGDDAVEHFGFIDGISQPALVTSDLPPPQDRTENDPSAGLALALLRDPFVRDDDACGSFFVFRKLEQNVRLFRDEEARLAAALGGIPRDQAGAMMVGRFQDGTPTVLAGAPSGASPPVNNFSYAVDPGTPPAFPAKCPFHAHIRKTNPRGDIGRQFGGGAAVDENERQRRVVRRGITYGSRDNDLGDAPSGGVGLLFQCYQSSIPDQFAFMQNSWANNEDFVRPGGSGHDSIIGQGPRGVEQTWPGPWGSNATRKLPGQRQLVTDKGGEFFWTPSMPFLQSLTATA
ncbi:Dyp-type peroxidase [Teichococcus oryzae]|uniref:Dyp-type peroxidase n=1 Tax=Teichococcus oryzae TaxID=1608942 RepID=A0A5B2TEN1_9PROT|nr:Dyp-type peroxidase [Pseudoroseomonas oryzae]KAA2212927.1 Dyp-type peroxidase [Pseudoroseomonas oryzae]